MSNCSQDQNDNERSASNTPTPFNPAANRPVPQTPVYNNRLANAAAFTQPSTDPYTRAAQSMYESFTPLSLQQTQRPTSLINQAPTGNFAYGTNPVRTQSMLTPQSMQNSQFNFIGQNQLAQGQNISQPQLNSFPSPFQTASQTGSVNQLGQNSGMNSPNMNNLMNNTLRNAAMQNAAQSAVMRQNPNVSAMNPGQMLQQQFAMRAQANQQRFF